MRSRTQGLPEVVAVGDWLLRKATSDLGPGGKAEGPGRTAIWGTAGGERETDKGGNPSQGSWRSRLMWSMWLGSWWKQSPPERPKSLHSLAPVRFTRPFC